MRILILSVAWILGAGLVARGAGPLHETPLTIVLEFQGPHSDRSVTAMERELESLLKDSGLQLDWRTRAEAEGKSFENLVVVRFKGKCILEPVGYLYDERGPLAFTYSTDGEVQPYSEVACDKIAASVRSALHGQGFGQADLLLGRALGRVVAHELIHILSKSGAHSHDGLTRPALSGQALIAPDMHLNPSDLERIYTIP